MQPLSADERWILNHLLMFGHAAAPIMKLGRKWVLRDMRGVSISPLCFTTKRAAMEAFEAWERMLRARERAERLAAAA